MSKQAKRTHVSKNQRKADEVVNHLSNHQEIDTTGVSVKVRDHSITLAGKIDNNLAKNLAGTIVRTEINQCGAVINDIEADRDISEEKK